MTIDAVERIAPTSKVWQTGILALVVSAVINLVLYFVASALSIPFDVLPPGVPAPPFALAIIFATSLTTLIGTLLFWQMPRFSKKPISTWRMVAIGVVLLSLVSPLSLLMGGDRPVAPISTLIVLEAMHILTGAVAIYFLTTRARA